MDFRGLFKQTKKRDDIVGNGEKPEIPEGLFVKCKYCKCVIDSKELADNLYVCPKCGKHEKTTAKQRLAMTVEEDSFYEWNFGIETVNVLGALNYDSKIEDMRNKTGLKEAMISGSAMIGNTKVAIAICDSNFMMASMGHYLGEQIRKTVERATKERLPLVIFASSGGARMQEGIISLMQMAKTSAALKRHSEAGLLYISVLTNPTTGGVTASYASLGDIMLSEPGALIGFAGPRVIEQTIKQKLPEGFQSSEFQLEHGFLDRIVERKDMKEEIEHILELNKRVNEIEITKANEKLMSDLLKVRKPKKSKKRKEEKTAWDIVMTSRSNKRPVALDYIDTLFNSFIEFHGDRLYGDDGAIIGGIADFAGIPVTVIAQSKGRDTKSNIEKNFGMPSPEGYRKSLRLMKQAEKFGRPIICIVDTPGAYCGISAEEGGQGEAIARNLMEMSDLSVPILSIVIGEAGSGGALALAVADEVWMLENSMYAILSPEGYASILWKDGSKANLAAEEMKLTANDLLSLDVIEKIIEEPENYSVEKIGVVAKDLQRKIAVFLRKYSSLGKEEIKEHRYNRFAKF